MAGSASASEINPSSEAGREGLVPMSGRIEARLYIFPEEGSTTAFSHASPETVREWVVSVRLGQGTYRNSERLSLRGIRIQKFEKNKIKDEHA